MSDLQKTFEESVFDEGYSGIPVSPLCSLCDHYKPLAENLYRCRAFEKIPLDIWSAKNPHLSPYQGDKGFRFEIKPMYLQ
jgi:hypothetical protein